MEKIKIKLVIWKCYIEEIYLKFNIIYMINNFLLILRCEKIDFTLFGFFKTFNVNYCILYRKSNFIFYLIFNIIYNLFWFNIKVYKFITDLSRSEMKWKKTLKYLYWLWSIDTEKKLKK